MHSRLSGCTRRIAVNSHGTEHGDSASCVTFCMSWPPQSSFLLPGRVLWHYRRNQDKWTAWDIEPVKGNAGETWCSALAEQMIAGDPELRYPDCHCATSRVLAKALLSKRKLSSRSFFDTMTSTGHAWSYADGGAFITSKPVTVQPVAQRRLRAKRFARCLVASEDARLPFGSACLLAMQCHRRCNGDVNAS